MSVDTSPHVRVPTLYLTRCRLRGRWRSFASWESSGVRTLDDYVDYERCESLHGDGSCVWFVKFLLDGGLGTFSEEDLIMAIQSKQLEVAELLIEHNCPIGDDIVDYALMSRQLQFAKRLVGRGCTLQRGAYRALFEELWENDETLEFDYIPYLNWINSVRRIFDFKGLEEMERDGWGSIFTDRPDVKDLFDQMISRHHMDRMYKRFAKKRRR